jgi:hypothetical protein
VAVRGAYGMKIANPTGNQVVESHLIAIESRFEAKFGVLRDKVHAQMSSV